MPKSYSLRINRLFVALGTVAAALVLMLSLAALAHPAAARQEISVRARPALAPPPKIDLAVGKTVNDDTPDEGDTIVYTIVLTNNGPGAAGGIVVSDSLPAGVTYITDTATTGSYSASTWEINDLPAGSTGTLTISATVDEGAAGSIITNTALLTNSMPVDSDESNDQDQAVITVRKADLAVGKTVNDDTPDEGDTIVYTIVLTNNGPHNAGGIVVSDSLPAGVTYITDTATTGSYSASTWEINDLPAGSTGTLTISVTVDEGAAGRIITNTAVLTSSAPEDSDESNNQGQAVITVRADSPYTPTLIYLPAVLRNYPPSWQLGSGSTGRMVYHIAACPDDPTILYAGAREQGVLKSIDAGEDWAVRGLVGERVYAATVMTNTGCNTAYATTWGQGVQKSTDGGVSWGSASAGLGSSYLNFIVADPTGTLYAATHNGVYRSTDGQNWGPRGLSGVEVLHLAIDPDNSSRIYAGTSGDGIHLSENGGATWALANAGLTGDWVLWSLSVMPGTNDQDGPTVVAGSNDRGVFISTDGGSTWERRWPAAYEQKVYTVLALNQDSQLAIFAGTSRQGVYRSTDGGVSWASYSQGLTNMESQFLSASGDYIYLGTAGGAWRRELVR